MIIDRISVSSEPNMYKKLIEMFNVKEPSAIYVHMEDEKDENKIIFLHTTPDCKIPWEGRLVDNVSKGHLGGLSYFAVNNYRFLFKTQGNGTLKEYGILEMF